MMTLLWQTAALLLTAYFLGAFLGCLIRRTFFAKAPTPDAEPAYAGVPSSVALAGMPDPEPVPLATASAYQAAQPAYGVESVEPSVAPRVGDAATTAEPEAVGGVPYPQADAAIETEGPREAAEGQLQYPPEAEPAQPAPQEPSAPYRPVVPPAGERKRSIGTSAAAAAALAAATARYRAAQEAARAAGPVSVTAGSFDGAASAVAAQPTAPSAAAPATDTADDLTRIRGIDPELSKKLSALGVRKFSDMAAWRKEDVQRVSAALGFRGRIEQENWIEQAQILATGTETAYSRRRAGMAPLAQPSADQGERRAPTAAQPAPAEAAAPAAATAPEPKKPPTGLGRHHLQRIKGITPDIERLLNVHGVHRYEHIARWTAADVKKFDQLLGKKGRIANENWIEQAQILANRGLTAFAREFDQQHTAAPPRLRPAHLLDAIREAQAASSAAQTKPAEDAGSEAKPKFDLSTLRSVRSEAFLSEKPEVSPPPSPAPGAPKRVDDLKRIRGIGVSLEKRLNGMGYWTYEQIASWTAADVDRVSRALDIRGRIEQENWIEQAQILATGGQTWFARRHDRGERAIDPASKE